MPILALTVLLSWPVIVAILFSRLPRPQALIWSIYAGYLLLPPLVEIDLPVFPGLNKAMVPALASRSARLAARAAPFLRRASTAAS